MNQTDILIIGVIYNTYPETIRYLDSLANIVSGKFTLILVDNSDKVKPLDFQKKISSYPFLHYLETGKNTGYFGGAREGLKYYLKEHSTYPRWILVTNVDIVFTRQFFDQLIRIGDPEKIGVIASSIISKRWNTDYNPKIPDRYSKRKLQFYQFLYSSFLIHNIFLVGAYLKKLIMSFRRGKKEVIENPAQSGRKIYAPHGSCLIFNKNYFISGGTLNLPNFLFGEEIFVAETAMQLGLDIIYDPRLIIYDYEHASVGFFVTPTTNIYYRQANQMVLDRYYS
jgi:GT2 family glycosyltransferase